MSIRVAALLALAVAPAFCGDWNPRQAEQYMDSRQKVWDAWPTALHSGVACVSCHTGLPYLLARPALRQALNERTGPTLYEGLLVSSMRATVIHTDAKDLFGGLKGLIVDQVYGAQVVLASLVLGMDDAPRGRLSPEGEKAFERLWSTQLKSGPDKGNWLWSDFDLDPWETKDAAFYGGALAALATGVAPGGQMTMVAVGGSIGTGLLLGTAAAIELAGPSVILSFVLAAFISWTVALALGELASTHPAAGSFGVYGDLYLNHWAGFISRAGYWLAIAVSIGAEMVAATTYMQLWFPQVPSIVWVLAFSALLLAVNFLSVHNYGRFEFWFAMIKAAVIAIFIVLGATLLLTGRAAPQYTAHGGFFPLGPAAPAPRHHLRHLHLWRCRVRRRDLG